MKSLKERFGRASRNNMLRNFALLAVCLAFFASLAFAQ
jgi:hypothetical protein